MLAFGNGGYQISVYEWSHDNFYITAFSETISVQLMSDEIPFLHSNFFVDYQDSDAVVNIAETLYMKAKNPQEFIESVYNVVKVHSYDYDKAAFMNQEGTLYKTRIDDILENKTGICLDYASVMVAMLRSQGVPAKLVFGYVEDKFHS